MGGASTRDSFSYKIYLRQRKRGFAILIWLSGGALCYSHLAGGKRFSFSLDPKNPRTLLYCRSGGFVVRSAWENGGVNVSPGWKSAGPTAEIAAGTFLVRAGELRLRKIKISSRILVFTKTLRHPGAILRLSLRFREPQRPANGAPGLIGIFAAKYGLASHRRQDLLEIRSLPSGPRTPALRRRVDLADLRRAGFRVRPASQMTVGRVPITMLLRGKPGPLPKAVLAADSRLLKLFGIVPPAGKPRKATADGARSVPPEVGGRRAGAGGCSAGKAPANPGYPRLLRRDRMAAANGNGAAMSDIGLAYELGHGVPRDYHKAMQWYRKAAARGYGGAMASIGGLYLLGRGVPRDYGKAMKWDRKGAAAGNARAMGELGVLYYHGWGAPRDYHKAAQWYRKAAARGNGGAMASLGVLYSNGWGVPRNYRKAMVWFRRAAARGYGGAMADIGGLYTLGQGVPQSYRKAMVWCRKAAATGNGVAMMNIGLLYRGGLGVPQDYGRAMRWFRKGAAVGNAKAMTNLGVFYFHGWGVPKDLAKAKAWFEKAAKAGDPQAKQALGELKVLAPVPKKK